MSIARRTVCQAHEKTETVFPLGKNLMTLPSIDFGGIDHEQIMFEQGLHPVSSINHEG